MIRILSYIKAQAVFTVASFADYGVTFFVVEGWHAPYLAGNLAGNIFGALTQFLLCRHWVFRAGGMGATAQLSRFILVYTGDLALSAAGVWLFTHCAGLHYIASKLITSVTLGMTYNYLLQKRFVFHAAPNPGTA
jgi:putative flippase GtrA